MVPGRGSWLDPTMRSSLPLLLALTLPALGAACDGGGSGASGGTGGTGGATQGGQGGTGASAGAGGTAGTGGAVGGQGGTGGTIPCGAPDDPDNCGTCGNVCAPGQLCSAGVCTCNDPMPVSFAADVQPVLTASCAKTNCHTGAFPDAGLDLTAGVSWGELVGQTATQCNDGRLLVEAGHPESSYLIDKVTNHDICGAKKKMPPTGSLSLANQEKLSAWICLGALDD